MASKEEVLETYKQHVLKSIAHLEYSYNRVKNLPIHVADLNFEQIEIWEGFLARFARTGYIFFNKYLRTIVLIKDPAFEGSFIDLLNTAAKLHIIDDDLVGWTRIRALRNQQTHEYSDEKLYLIFQESLDLVEKLINLKTTLQIYAFITTLCRFNKEISTKIL
jgi:hypothetical protein